MSEFAQVVEAIARGVRLRQNRRGHAYGAASVPVAVSKDAIGTLCSLNGSALLSLHSESWQIDGVVSGVTIEASGKYPTDELKQIASGRWVAMSGKQLRLTTDVVRVEMSGGRAIVDVEFDVRIPGWLSWLKRVSVTRVEITPTHGILTSAGWRSWFVPQLEWV